MKSLFQNENSAVRPYAGHCIPYCHWDEEIIRIFYDGWRSHEHIRIVIVHNKPFEDCLNVGLPGTSSSSPGPKFLREIVNSRWLFDMECELPIFSEAENCDSKNGKRRSSRDDDSKSTKKKKTSETPGSKWCALAANMKRWICTESILKPSLSHTDLAIVTEQELSLVYSSPKRVVMNSSKLMKLMIFHVIFQTFHP
jgi:hypothetical protein